MRYIKDGLLVLLIFMLIFVILPLILYGLYLINKTVAILILSLIGVLVLSYIIGSIMHMDEF